MGTFPPAYLGQWRSATHFLTNSSLSAHYFSGAERWWWPVTLSHVVVFYVSYVWSICNACVWGVGFSANKLHSNCLEVWMSNHKVTWLSCLQGNAAAAQLGALNMNPAYRNLAPQQLTASQQQQLLLQQGLNPSQVSFSHFDSYYSTPPMFA